MYVKLINPEMKNKLLREKIKEEKNNKTQIQLLKELCKMENITEITKRYLENLGIKIINIKRYLKPINNKQYESFDLTNSQIVYNIKEVKKENTEIVDLTLSQDLKDLKELRDFKAKLFQKEVSNIKIQIETLNQNYNLNPLQKGKLKHLKNKIKILNREIEKMASHKDRIKNSLQEIGFKKYIKESEFKDITESGIIGFIESETINRLINKSLIEIKGFDKPKDFNTDIEICDFNIETNFNNPNNPNKQFVEIKRKPIKIKRSVKGYYGYSSNKFETFKNKTYAL